MKKPKPCKSILTNQKPKHNAIWIKNLDQKSQNSYNDHKGVIMQTVTASEIKQNSSILQNALRDDMLVTKRDKPFVVVVDYERYMKLIAQNSQTSQKNWIEETFGAMSVKDSSQLLEDITQNRVNKEIDLWS